jgi:hypothetical protein
MMRTVARRSRPMSLRAVSDVCEVLISNDSVPSDLRRLAIDADCEMAATPCAARRP